MVWISEKVILGGWQVLTSKVEIMRIMPSLTQGFALPKETPAHVAR
jgi:hypothetical protein